MCTPFDGMHPSILQEASEAPKVDMKEEPAATPASALPPSGAMPPWARDGAPELGEGRDRAGEEGAA